VATGIRVALGQAEEDMRTVIRIMRIRPDVDVRVVFRDSRAYTVPAVRLHLVFVFEDHPVTPARRR
jgi:hypothetical protein